MFMINIYNDIYSQQKVNRKTLVSQTLCCLGSEYISETIGLVVQSIRINLLIQKTIVIQLHKDTMLVLIIREECPRNVGNKFFLGLIVAFAS